MFQTPRPVESADARRLPGLDGLRALAIVLVLAYHLFPGLAPGGFLGVDVFLVVSGYLITTLLIEEHARSGRIALRRFWARRARRLLPALVLVVAVSAGLAALMGGDVLVGIGWQLVGALTFSYNWFSIATGADYLTQTSPELLRHLWSLAVEEQFYLLWPVALLALLAIARPGIRIAVVSALAAASAAAMALVAGDPALDTAAASAAYFSTLTHGFGLAAGAALALLRSQRARGGDGPARARLLTDALGVLAGLGLVGLSLVLTIDGAATYRGGLVVAVALTLAVIAAADRPQSRLVSVLDAPLPRWVGERSYGLYLWHWPLIVLLGARLTELDRASLGETWLLGVIALAGSVLLAAGSYRLVESPFRRAPRAARAVPLRAVAAAGVLALLAASSTAVAQAPPRSEAAELIATGQVAVAESQRRAERPLPRDEEPAAAVAGTLPSGDEITAIGDSVMLAAAPQLQERFPGIAIDAVVSRQMRQAPQIVRALVESDRLRDTVVLGLGTNGPIDPETLHEVRALLGPERTLVLVSAQAPRGWTEGVNAHLVDFARTYRLVELSDWRAAISPQLSLLAPDQIHPGPTGGQVYTETLAAALQRIADLPPLVDYEANPGLQRPR
ncbi:acyltransferase family protein [Microcella indica]|uniref:acyltransferase family protein n=1 Tax=Microcella indica TaxID=2750620 RepID=UPI0015CF5FCA|nr:acyltransferase family protein [Microcella indica]